MANVKMAMEYAAKIDREALEDRIGKWVGLTDEEINSIDFPESGTATMRDFVRIGDWVMRITQDCISVNNNVSVDDAAQAVVAAIGRYLNKSKWVGMTDDELFRCSYDADGFMIDRELAMRAVEAKLRSRNGG